MKGGNGLKIITHQVNVWVAPILDVPSLVRALKALYLSFEVCRGGRQPETSALPVHPHSLGFPQAAQEEQSFLSGRPEIFSGVEPTQTIITVNALYFYFACCSG